MKNMFNKKPKQFMDHLDGISKEKCNEVENSALLRLAQDIKTSADLNSSMSPREGFQESLRQEILAKKQEKNAHMEKKMPSFNSIFKPKRLWFSFSISALVVLIVLSTIYIWPIFRVSPDGDNLFSGFSKLIISPVFAQDNFELQAVKKDSLGVESDTSYVLTSKEPLETSLVKDSLKIEPQIDFDLKTVSNTQWEIVPKDAIDANTLLKVSLASSYLDETGNQKERDYSWAFQVKDSFKILHTIPGKNSTGVPLDSGIEVTFSHDNFVNFEKYFSISPNVSGKFEKHGRTLVFVPNNLLTQGTIYTVTVKKDIELQDAKNFLSQDYSFNFETVQESNVYSSASFDVSDKFVEFSTLEKPMVQVASYHPDNESKVIAKVNVELFKYQSLDAYLSTMKKIDALPAWSSSRYDFREDITGMQKLSSFETEVEIGNYNQYVEFPESLGKGFYLAQFIYADGTEQAYIQVSDLAAYANFTQTDSVVWVNDLNSKIPVDGANVELIGTQVLYKTNGQGISSFETPSQVLGSVDISDNENAPVVYIKIEKNNDIVVLRNEGLSTFDKTEYQKSSDAYWKYLYTDRPLYKPNDVIKFWGMLKDRNDKSIPDDIKISLYKDGYVDYYYQPVNILEQNIKLSKDGIFSGELKLNNVRPDYYTVQIEMGDTILLNKYINIESYTKPAYEIVLESDKDMAYAGESIYFKARAQFFEGTPVPDLALVINTPQGEQKGVTNERGETEFSYSEVYTDCQSAYGCWPEYKTISVYPQDSEFAEITAEKNVSFYGPHVYGNTEISYPQKGLAEIKISTKNIDFNTLEADAWWQRGMGEIIAPNTKIVGELIKTTYTKRETGTQYDYIEKRTFKTYEYDKKVEVVDTFTVNTNDQGVYIYNRQIEPETSYKIKLKIYDSFGKYDIQTSYLYYFDGIIQNLYNDNNYPYYHIDLPDTKRYDVGEQVEARLLNNQELVSDGQNKFLFLQLQNGLQEYRIQNSAVYQFPFESRDIPNVNLTGVFFNGRNYTIAETGYSSSGAKYDTKNRQLKINVSSDKATYKPGEHVKLSLKVTDASNNSKSAQVNLNLVDEAFYALADETVDPIEKIYETVYSGSLYSDQTHRNFTDMYGGAEFGGCFVGGTQISMADGSYKSIEDVTIGDTIKTFDNAANQDITQGTVTEVFVHVVSQYLVINDDLKVTPEHLVYTNNRFNEAGKLKVGDWLLKSNGEKVFIQTIDLVSRPTKVYNFRVDPQHTYFAGDFYVHNEKGGGPREFFADAALFQVVETDDNGNAHVEFDLPDNVTSWRVTAQAITNDLYIGANTQKIPVSLPVFAQIDVAEQYLQEDKPIIKLRAFGNALNFEDSVNFVVKAPSLGVEKSDTLNTSAFTSTYFSLPQLTLGNHSLTYELNSQKGKDAVKLPIQVIDSRLEAQHVYKEKLTTDTHVEAKNDKPIAIILSDQGQNNLYGPLQSLSWTWGDRVDQILSKKVARELLNTYYKEEIISTPVNADLYQYENGGISLLPYSDPDLELSGRIASLHLDVFDTQSLGQYFFSILEDRYSNREQMSLALFGLAELGEPILPRLQVWLTRDDLSAKEKIYLAQALYDIGDAEHARDMYLELIGQYGEVKDPYIVMRVSDKLEQIFQATASTFVLSSSLNMPESTGLWNYLNDSQQLYGKQKNSDELYNIEKLNFIAHMLPHLKPSPAKVTYSLSGRKIDVTLTGGSVHTFTIEPQQVNDLKFELIEGDVGISMSYTESLNIFQTSADQSISISRDYYVKGNKTNTFNQKDLVEVRLYPSFGQKSISGSYQITDLLPSGLMPLTKFSVRDVKYWYGHCIWYPYDIDGQVVKFMLDKKWSYNGCTYIQYYARVRNPGEYKAEPTIIQSFINPEYINYSTDQTVTISQ